MTLWTDSPGSGRPRGIRGLARSWTAVMTRPRRFFRTAVAPGDQAPGLTFLLAVVLVEEAVRVSLDPGAVPVYGGRPLVSRAFVVGLAALVVAPLALHLVAAVQTAFLLVFVRERAGISETVQVLAYATAPAALAGAPAPTVRVAVGLYGAVLVAVGMGTVHETSLWRAALSTAVPSAIVFGYGFRAFAAAAALWPDVFGGFVGAGPG